MKSDPIVEEIRVGRIAHAERFDFDISKIAADYRSIQQKKDKDRIQLGAKKPVPPQPAN